MADGWMDIQPSVIRIYMNDIYQMKKYQIKVLTFGKTLNLWVGGTKKEFDDKLGKRFNYDYDCTSGVTIYDGECNKNIIRLKEYSLNALVHELVHCTQFICEQCGIPIEGETPAYIYEELFCKIIIKLGDKFKIEKKSKTFYK